MLQETSTKQPDPLIERFNLGISYYRNRVFDLAIECFTDILNQNNLYPGALLCRAKAYSAAHYYVNAFADFEAWFKQNPNHNDVHAIAYFAYTEFKLGKFKEAIADYTRALALEIDPMNRTLALICRGESYYQTKDLDKALTDLMTAQREAKEVNQAVSLRIAEIYFKQNEYQLALEMLNATNQVTLSNDSLIKLLSLRHAVYMALKDAERALIDVQYLKWLAPDKKEYYEQLSLFITGGNVAKNGNMTYKSTLAGSSVELDELVFEPDANEKPIGGSIANTRFFKTSNEGGARFVVKKESAVYASKKLHLDEQYRNEAEAWNAMNPRYPSFFFEFPYASCRLVLPRVPGAPFRIVKLDSAGKLVEYLQIWLGIGLELNRLHQLNKIHGDLKGDNIIVHFDQEAGYYRTTLIDFGLTTSVDEPAGGYGGRRAHNIAPELYGNHIIPSAFSADVYSFSSAIQVCCNNTLPAGISTIFANFGCAQEASKRPPLEQLIALLWSELINLISSAGNDETQLALDTNSAPLIANFIKHMEPLSFKVLMTITNKLEADRCARLLSNPVIVNAIVNTHATHASSLPAFDGVVKQLLESNSNFSSKGSCP